MNANPDDPEEFKQQVAAICQLYEQVPTLSEQGIHLVSTDEMTGIQALERAHATSGGDKRPQSQMPKDFYLVSCRAKYRAY